MEIKNKSDFVVCLAQNCKCGITNMPISTLDIKCANRTLWLNGFDPQDNHDGNNFEGFCVNSDNLVWSCFNNGCRAILNSSHDQQFCTGIERQWSYYLNDHIYWIILMRTGDFHTLKFIYDDYIDSVKEAVAKLGDAHLCQMFQKCIKEATCRCKECHTMYIMIGIPASGKSSYCKSHEHLQDIAISLDDVRTRANEKFLIDDAFYQGTDIAIDNTNVSWAERAKYIAMAKEHGYRVEGYFFRSAIHECIERNKHRPVDKQVPELAILSKSNQLEIPSYSEGFDKLTYISIDNGMFNEADWKG